MPRQYSNQRSQAARKTVAAMLPAPCTICRRAVTADMRWQADHITPRIIAEAQGWTLAQMDSPANLGPAHKTCNESAGTRLGNQLRAQAKAKPRTVPQVKRPSIGGGHV